METLVYCCNKCTSGTESSRMGCKVKLMLIAKVGLTLLIHQRQRSTLNEKSVALQLLSSNGPPDHIMQDVHQYHKVCASRVSRYLASEPHERRMDVSKELLGRYQTDGDPFLQRIVTVDES